MPSTRIFVVPFGRRTTCMSRATTPIRKRSPAAGSCWSAFRCATSSTTLPSFAAASTAASECARPMSSGMTTYGNTTTSRSGSTGKPLGYLKALGVAGKDQRHGRNLPHCRLQTTTSAVAVSWNWLLHMKSLGTPLASRGRHPAASSRAHSNQRCCPVTPLSSVSSAKSRAEAACPASRRAQ